MYRLRSLAAVLPLAAVTLFVRPLAAQRPTHADTTAVIFEETFPGPYEVLTLAGETAYRVEVRSSDPQLPPAEIVVHSLTHSIAPPLLLTPLSDEAITTGGHSYLLIPDRTDDYRIDVVTPTPLYVRIIRDGAESRRWAAARARRGVVPSPGAGVSAIAMGNFPLPVAASNTIAGEPAAGAHGLGFCAGSFANGGCAVDVGLYNRGGTGTTVSVALEPRSRIGALGPVRFWMGEDAGLMVSTISHYEMTYAMFGLGPVAEIDIAAPHRDGDSGGRADAAAPARRHRHGARDGPAVPRESRLPLSLGRRQRRCGHRAWWRGSC